MKEMREQLKASRELIVRMDRQHLGESILAAIRSGNVQIDELRKSIEESKDGSVLLAIRQGNETMVGLRRDIRSVLDVVRAQNAPKRPPMPPPPKGKSVFKRALSKIGL